MWYIGGGYFTPYTSIPIRANHIQAIMFDQLVTIYKNWITNTTVCWGVSKGSSHCPNPIYSFSLVSYYKFSMHFLEKGLCDNKTPISYKIGHEYHRE